MTIQEEIEYLADEYLKMVDEIGPSWAEIPEGLSEAMRGALRHSFICGATAFALVPTDG